MRQMPIGTKTVISAATLDIREICSCLPSSRPDCTSLGAGKDVWVFGLFMRAEAGLVVPAGWSCGVRCKAVSSNVVVLSLFPTDDFLRIARGIIG
jgi:hypothetical protein